MRGSIRQQSKNSFQITIDMGRGPNGKRLRHFETVKSPRKSDAQKRLNELLVSLEKGVYTPPGKLTVAEHLHNWLNGYVKTQCSIRTFDAVQGIIENHIIPELGNIKLKELQPQTIQEYYSKASEKLTPRGERLSNRSIHYHHRILKQALKYAVRQGFLGRNPSDLVDAPKFHKKPMRTLIAEEVEILLNAASGSYYYPVIYTAVSTGLRQAELLGLRWRDIDLDMLSISVSQVLYKRRGICELKEPKTERSRRSVRMTPKLALYLREYKAERESISWQLGKPLSLDDLVFTNIEGKPMDPSVLSHTFLKIARQIKLKDVRFHDLRHTFASLMLQRGAKPKVIQEALGHSSVAFTMDVYSHIIEGMQEDAIALLDEVLPAGINEKSFVAKMSRNRQNSTENLANF